jgi:hypothetical protein
MDTLPSAPPPPTDLNVARPERSGGSFLSEVFFLGSTYFVTAFFGGFTIGACSPNCCFVFFSILAGVSALLMLRRPIGSRVFCLIMLLLSLAGMWHEMKAYKIYDL